MIFRNVITTIFKCISSKTKTTEDTVAYGAMEPKIEDSELPSGFTEDSEAPTALMEYSDSEYDSSFTRSELEQDSEEQEDEAEDDSAPAFFLTLASHPTDCNCGAPNCTIDGLFQSLMQAMEHFKDVDTETSTMPTQKVTWSVEDNTIDWDLEAMCLCGVRECKLKFGANPKRRFVNIYTVGGFVSEEHRKEMKKLEEKEKKMEEEAMRDFIGRLEKQKRQLEEDPSHHDFAPSPLTLWSGVPFARMDREQLRKSRSELTELVKGRRIAASIQWGRVYDAQRWLGVERTAGGFVDAMMTDAERMEERVEHDEMMLRKVECMLNFF